MDGGKIAVRPMRREDAEVFAREEIAQGWIYASPEKLLARMADAEKGLCAAWTAELDGVPAGYVSLYYRPGDGPFAGKGIPEIVDMDVLEKFRRRGVASALVSRMLVLMPAGDVSVTTFRAGDAKGAAPRALYARFGFEPAEELMEFDYPVQRMVLRAERRAGEGRGDARPDAAQHMEEADGNQEGRVH